MLCCSLENGVLTAWHPENSGISYTSAHTYQLTLQIGEESNLTEKPNATISVKINFA